MIVQVGSGYVRFGQVKSG